MVNVKRVKISKPHSGADVYRVIIQIKVTMINANLKCKKRGMPQSDVSRFLESGLEILLISSSRARFWICRL